MLLFFTLEARFRFSIEERLAGDGEPSRWPTGALFSEFNRVGDPVSRLCQYSRGEFDAKGDGSKGDESPLKADILVAVSPKVLLLMV